MTIVFLLEEVSMREFLKGLLPRILKDGIDWRLIPHEGKQDLENSIPRKLRAWRTPNTHFVIVRDQDSADCMSVKERLRSLCRVAGKEETLVRIACRELESWFLADLAAVERAFNVGGLASKQNKRKFREPDRLGSPSRVLEELVSSYAKVSGARRLGPLVDIENKRSRSFHHFVAGVRRMMESQTTQETP